MVRCGRMVVATMVFLVSIVSQNRWHVSATAAKVDRRFVSPRIRIKISAGHDGNGAAIFVCLWD